MSSILSVETPYQPKVRGRNLKIPRPTDGAGPRSLEVAINAHLQSLVASGYAASTVASRAFYLGRFRDWCGGKAASQCADVTTDVVDDYQAQLYNVRTGGGRPLSTRSLFHHLHALKMFVRWLCLRDWLPDDPARFMRLPRLGLRLPATVFTAAEAEAVLRQPNLLSPLGLRDRAVLEVLYSTGMRRAELAGLSVWDVQPSDGTIRIRDGKGHRDRVVPIGDRALAWVDRYLTYVRPACKLSADEDHLFLTRGGLSLMPSHLSAAVGSYIRAAGLGKHGSCHAFRHTCATLMLEGGADIRYIQELLGHASLASTQIYTRVSIRRLKDVHTATHPASVGTPLGTKRLVAEELRTPVHGTEANAYRNAVGARLMELRIARGLSREALARRVQTTRGHIRKLEQGIHPPRQVMAEKLAAALAVDPSDLAPTP